MSISFEIYSRHGSCVLNYSFWLPLCYHQAYLILNLLDNTKIMKPYYTLGTLDVPRQGIERLCICVLRFLILLLLLRILKLNYGTNMTCIFAMLLYSSNEGVFCIWCAPHNQWPHFVGGLKNSKSSTNKVQKTTKRSYVILLNLWKTASMI